MTETQTDLEVREQALAYVRDGLASFRKVPAAGLSKDKHGQLTDVLETAQALEAGLTNEVEQLREATDE